jgi:acyl dehydratase
MSTHAQNALEIFRQYIGKEEGVGDWQKVDQSQINLFADATGDHQWIHVDPERAAKLSPYKTTIAHGFLTLSLVPHLSASVPQLDASAYQGITMGINYGLDRVRFPSAVKVDARVRARRELLEAELKAPNTVQLKNRVTIEIEGEEKPACVAETLTRLVFA